MSLFLTCPEEQLAWPGDPRGSTDDTRVFGRLGPRYGCGRPDLPAREQARQPARDGVGDQRVLRARPCAADLRRARPAAQAVQARPALLTLIADHNPPGEAPVKLSDERPRESAPGMIRTCDLCLRRAALYPLSYGRWGTVSVAAPLRRRPAGPRRPALRRGRSRAHVPALHSSRGPRLCPRNESRRRVAPIRHRARGAAG